MNAKHLVHAGTAVAVIGLDDRVAVYDQLPGRVRHTWDFQASELRIVPGPRGGGALFALSAGRVWWAWKPSVLAPWSDWEPLGGPAERLAAAAVPRQPFARWMPWLDLRGHAVAVLGQQSYTEGLEAFVLGTDDGVRHAWCARLGTPWTDWQLLDRETAGFRPGSSHEERVSFPAG